MEIGAIQQEIRASQLNNQPINSMVTFQYKRDMNFQDERRRLEEQNQERANQERIRRRRINGEYDDEDMDYGEEQHRQNEDNDY